MRWLFPREGVTVADLRPIDRVGEQSAPVFVLAGTADRYTTLTESRALFERAREPKEFWAVEGAAHVDLHAFAGTEYERRVGAFLRRHVRTSARDLLLGTNVLLMTVISFVVGLSISGQTFYTFILENLEKFAALWVSGRRARSSSR